MKTHCMKKNLYAINEETIELSMKGATVVEIPSKVNVCPTKSASAVPVPPSTSFTSNWPFKPTMKNLSVLVL